MELIRDLDAVGVRVADLWELVNASVQHKPAVPVLLAWLRDLDDRVPASEQGSLREALVRALSIPAARPIAAPTLISEFKRVDDPSGLGLRWVIGNALEVVADDSVFDEVASLVRDRRYGKARQMVVVGLGRSRDPRAVPLLIGLVGDEDVAGHAAMALAKLKAAEARPALERLLQHSQPMVRREAKKALARIPRE